MNNPLQDPPYTIGILGATGTIGSIIVHSLLEQGFPPERLLLSNSKGGIFQFKHYSIPLLTDLKTVFSKADMMVLCIKPQIFKTLNLPYKKDQIIISPMVGISVDTILQKALQQNVNIKISRFMPNTACRISQGLIGVWNADLTVEEKMAIQILYHNNLVIEVNNEDELNKITVAASGIAFYFYAIELLKNIAAKINLTENETKKIILAACLEASQQPILKSPLSSSEKKSNGLENLFQNALCIVYLKALEFAGCDPATIQENPIAKQQINLISNLQQSFQKTNKTNISLATSKLSPQEQLKNLADLTSLSFINALQIFFTLNGFTAEQANQIALQTLKGAYGLLTEPNARSAAELRSNVTSKGGTTQAGLQALGLVFIDNIPQPDKPLKVKNEKENNYSSLYEVYVSTLKLTHSFSFFVQDKKLRNNKYSVNPFF